MRPAHSLRRKHLRESTSPHRSASAERLSAEPASCKPESTTLTEMGAFGIDPADTRPMMSEAMEIIPQLMTTDRFPGYKGKYFTVGQNRNVIPKPIQKPHPPMWMACSSPDSFNIAANNGLGVLCFNIARADTLEERVRNYREAIKAPKNQVTAKVNNQIAAFLMTLCGENNDETVKSRERRCWRGCAR